MPLDLSGPPGGAAPEEQPPPSPPSPLLDDAFGGRELPWSKRRLKKLIPAAIFVFGLFAWQFWQNHGDTGPRIYQWQGPTMGTAYQIKFVSPKLSAARTQEMKAALQGELDEVIALMSTYEPDSALSKFNASESTAPQTLPKPLLEVVAQSLEVNRASMGAFDLTVGPLVNAWGFGPDSAPTPPDEATRARLHQLVGVDKLTLDLAQGQLAKSAPEVYVDLSAIAKGYGVDRVADRLEALGVADYLVEIGGELRTKGRNLKGDLWRVGVERPRPGGGAIQQVVQPGDGGMATSGDYRNFREHEGRRYSHTFDPRRGEPVSHDLASVTVFHERAALADAWATALHVLGSQEGLQVAEAQGLAALFLVRTGPDAFETRQTPAFARHAVGAP